STGQVPQPDSLPEPRPVGIAKFSAPILQSYEPTYTVDIFDGPSFAFERTEAGQVEIDFLPWHRNWSHSLTVGALLAGISALWTWKAAPVVFGAYVIHVIEDQMGHMGSNLFFPITKKRSIGLKVMHSGDAFPNFAGVWLCCLLIFWNVYAAIDNPLYHFSFLRFMLYALVIPFAVFGILRWFLIRADGGEAEVLKTEWNI
ncbi:MAG TPA: metal-dependent hydrolase, partial [Tichowtungia sp.]|nr:metal-dependent hydrolase [Tichowtungia sp.]